MISTNVRSFFLLFSFFFFIYNPIPAQTVGARLQFAFQQFEKDTQLRNGLASLYVLEAKTDKVVFEKNAAIGLAPASTQKIITAATAYELLGNDFRYVTSFGYINANGNNSLYILPSGDPTFGSWRWKNTNTGAVLKNIVEAINQLKIKDFKQVLLDQTGWASETIPDGWIWQDIGNYYGAGAAKLNWRENQFDLILKSGSNTGDPVEIKGMTPKLHGYNLVSRATSAAKGTGDNAYIYFPVTSSSGIVRGTIPVGESRFIISGAMPSASTEFTGTLLDTLSRIGVANPKVAVTGNHPQQDIKINKEEYALFHSVTSPPLDSIIYWFHKKSINLYGEALVKTVAYQKLGKGDTDAGVSIIKEFWKTKGIHPAELNIVDGSGLSPLNRVTTRAQVAILQYAQKQSWFNGFYHSLPEFNGMKMKSGTIHNVKGFCGYHTAKNGNAYIFSFLINNYNGSALTLVRKMYKVLDVLK